MSMKNENNTKTIIFLLFLIMIIFAIFSVFEFVNAKEIQFVTSNDKEINITINDDDNILLFYEEEFRGNASYRTMYSGIHFCESSDFTTKLNSDKSVSCKFLASGNYGFFEKKLSDLSSVTNIDLSSYISNYPDEFYITSQSFSDIMLLFSGKNWDRTALDYFEVMNYQYYASKDFYDTETDDLLFSKSSPSEPSIDFLGNYNENNTLYNLTINYNNSDEYYNQYSIDSGKTWVTVLSSSVSLEITENSFVIGRVINSSGELITSSTMNISNIDTSNSLINFYIEYTTSRTSANLTIDYGAFKSGYREYSIDNGATWQYVPNRTIDISITRNMVVFARVRDSLGEYVTSSTYNVGDIVSQNPFYTDIESDDENFNLFQTILSKFNQKFPIVYEIVDFFNIFIDYTPKEYTSDYTPFEDIHLKIDEIGLEMTIPMKMYFYYEKRELTFIMIKLSFLIMFILKLWEEFQEKVGGVNK